MKLTFFGAAKAVTGSCYLIEACGKNVLIDCGLQQGRDEIDNRVLDFPPNTVDYVIVTHAHIDHSGRLPLLVKQGFSGKIFTTRLTSDLLGIMLRDSAHIQEMDAQWENQKGKRAGKEPVEPLYTVSDVETTLSLIEKLEYGQCIDIIEGLRICFTDAGHLLGSASVEMWIKEKAIEKKIVFSGDIGNIDQPVIRDPQPLFEADYVVMESTYGDRNHENKDSNYTGALTEILRSTFSRGGNVIIPSFAVGRTQELLYFIREIKQQNLMPEFPDFKVCVDSPLASEATTVYAGDLRGYLDEDAIHAMQNGGNLFTFPGLTLSRTTEESRALNADPTPKVIISASGMCDAGRIRHHLKHNLWRRECTVVFVGYQAHGTLGRRLLEGTPKVKLFGEEIAVRASIATLPGLSSHADRDHLIGWIKNFDPMPKEVFVVHGDSEVTDIFSNTLNEMGLSAHAPNYREVYDLASAKVLDEGIVRVTKRASSDGKRLSEAYLYLEEMGRRLLELIRSSANRPNKELRRLAGQIKVIIDNWK